MGMPPRTSPTGSTPALLSPPASRFLSDAECRTLLTRLGTFAINGGKTSVLVESSWAGNLRWARNQISTGGDSRNNLLTIGRNIRGAAGATIINQLDDPLLRVAVRRCERLVNKSKERLEDDLHTTFLEPFLQPKIWFDTTYQQLASERAEIVRTLVQPAVASGMLAAGYIEVSATGRAEKTLQASEKTSSPDTASTITQDWYYPYTMAQLSVTVRDPESTGSGWAGVSWNDWSRIDGTHLGQVALEKCLRSRNPVRLEPGRYTTILEPQAVFDLTKVLFHNCMSRIWAEGTSGKDSTYNPGVQQSSPFAGSRNTAKFGQRVIDDRLTVVTDPMDPDLGFPPFESGEVFHPVTWIQDGILKELSYPRWYAVQKLGKDTGGYPHRGAYKITARTPATSMEDMIATTERGLLVTRFWGITPPRDWTSVLINGYTRDGLWLIEKGKVSKPVKNFRFTDSPLFILNKVEQIGSPQRVFNPDAYRPAVVPALKVRDFSFTSLADAV